MKAKNLFSLTIIILGLVSQLNAQDGMMTSAFDQLLEVNAEWANHTDVIVDDVQSFDKDEDRIAFHLTEVINHLSQNPASSISTNVLAKRNHLLDELKSYAEAKVFPQNTFHAQRQPYFIDIYGTHCAVGYLMQVSGNEALAQQIKGEQNYDYIKDIKTEGVQEWADEFGFTTEELAWIQPGYPPTLPINTLEGGTNGVVKNMLKDNSTGDIYFAGAFEELNNLPCVNLGVYRDNVLECIGDGLTGTINDLFTTYNEPLFVGGQFENQGTTYPLAIYDDEAAEWQFVNIATREGATATCVAWNNDEQLLEMSIIDPLNPSFSEVWQMLDEENWTHVLTVNGVINDMIRGGTSEMVYAGQFDMATIPSGMGAPDLLINVNNVVIKNEMNWSGLDGEVSNEVNVINYYGNTYYFGGTCNNGIVNTEVCVSRFFNGVLQPLLLAQSFEEGSSSENIIKDILFNQGTMYLAGDFNIAPFVGTYGSGFASYDLASNSIEALAAFDGSVNCILGDYENLYLGGDFTQNLGDEINYLAHVDFASSTVDITDENALTIYPNPVRETLNLKGVDEPFSYTIYDLSGRLVSSQNRMGYSVELPHMESGIYLLNVLTQDGKSQTLKFVKE